MQNTGVLRKGGSMTQIKVSVITPIYNRRQFIDSMYACLASQTLPDIEFLIIDDCSTDGTFEKLSELLKKDHRFVLLRAEQNSGPSACRNLALQQATGEYIGFFDSDDIIPADYFANLYQIGCDNNADIIYTNYNDVKHIIPNIQSECDKFKSLRNGALWDKLYRAKHLQQHQLSFSEGLYCADNIFVIKAFYFASNIILCDYPRYQYALHTDSIGKDKHKMQKRKQDIITVCRIILNFADRQNIAGETLRSIKKFLARSFNEYKHDKQFRQNLAQVLGINIEEDTMTNYVEKHSRAIKLFFFLPIYGWKQRGGRKTWKILGLPVFTRRQMSNGITTKYYILGIPVMKVSNKLSKMIFYV